MSGKIWSGTAGKFWVAIFACICALSIRAHAVVVRMDDLLRERSGSAKISAAMIRGAVQDAAAAMKPGDALILPFLHDLGTVQLSGVPRDVQFIGGRNGRLVFSGPVRGLLIYGTQNVSIENASGLGKGLSGAASMADVWNVNTTGGISLTGAVSNTHWISHSLGSGKRMNVDGTMTNCTMVWFRYNSEKVLSGTPSMNLKLNGSGQGVKLLQLIEHNQGNKIQALVIDGGVGVQLANGATEGCGVTGKAVYQLINCSGVHLAQREMFSNHRPTSSWYGAPSFSVMVSGTGNIIDNLQEYANPQALSLVSTDPKLQIWSSSFEDSAALGTSEGQFLTFFVDNSMIKANDQFSEPRLIDGEIVCAWNGPSGLIDLTQPGAVLPEGVKIPEPPSMPVCDIPPSPDLKYKKAANFGRDVLLAGADPTGRVSSTAAFEKIINSRNLLEIPAGTFRIDRPLHIRADRLSRTGVFGGKKVWMIGAGKGATRIVGSGSGALVSLGEPGNGLSRMGSAYAPQQVEFVCEGLDYIGGSIGVEVANQINVVLTNVQFRDQTYAGMTMISSSSEQSRFIACDFTNTGDYGVRAEGYQDKNLFFRCRFGGQKKAGISGISTKKWHSGVYQCSFSNITGPGFSISTGNDTYGFENWVLTVDSCTFIECGSASEPVVDFGYSRLSVLSNSVVTTRNKQVFGGFRGNFSVIDNVTFDLSLTSDIALHLGHQRFGKTCGLGGSRLTRVTTNGKIVFLNYDEYITDTYHVDNLYAEFPWRFGYVFHKVKSGNYDVDFALINNGKVTDMPGYIATRVKPSQLLQHQADAGDAFIYDIRGRRMARATNAGLRQGSAAGMYLQSRNGATSVKRTLNFK